MSISREEIPISPNFKVINKGGKKEGKVGEFVEDIKEEAKLRERETMQRKKELELEEGETQEGDLESVEKETAEDSLIVGGERNDFEELAKKAEMERDSEVQKQREIKTDAAEESRRKSPEEQLKKKRAVERKGEVKLAETNRGEEIIESPAEPIIESPTKQGTKEEDKKKIENLSLTIAKKHEAIGYLDKSLKNERREEKRREIREKRKRLSSEVEEYNKELAKLKGEVVKETGEMETIEEDKEDIESKLKGAREKAEALKDITDEEIKKAREEQIKENIPNAEAMAESFKKQEPATGKISGGEEIPSAEGGEEVPIVPLAEEIGTIKAMDIETLDRNIKQVEEYLKWLDKKGVEYSVDAYKGEEYQRFGDYLDALKNEKKKKEEAVETEREPETIGGKIERLNIEAVEGVIIAGMFRNATEIKKLEKEQMKLKDKKENAQDDSEKKQLDNLIERNKEERAKIVIGEALGSMENEAVELVKVYLDKKQGKITKEEELEYLRRKRKHLEDFNISISNFTELKRIEIKEKMASLPPERQEAVEKAKSGIRGWIKRQIYEDKAEKKTTAPTGAEAPVTKGTETLAETRIERPAAEKPGMTTEGTKITEEEIQEIPDRIKNAGSYGELLEVAKEMEGRKLREENRDFLVKIEDCLKHLERDEEYDNLENDLAEMKDYLNSRGIIRKRFNPESREIFGVFLDRIREIKSRRDAEAVVMDRVKKAEDFGELTKIIGEVMGERQIRAGRMIIVKRDVFEGEFYKSLKYLESISKLYDINVGGVVCLDPKDKEKIITEINEKQAGVNRSTLSESEKKLTEVLSKRLIELIKTKSETVEEAEKREEIFTSSSPETLDGDGEKAKSEEEREMSDEDVEKYVSAFLTKDELDLDKVDSPDKLKNLLDSLRLEIEILLKEKLSGEAELGLKIIKDNIESNRFTRYLEDINIEKSEEFIIKDSVEKIKLNSLRIYGEEILEKIKKLRENKSLETETLAGERVEGREGGEKEKINEKKKEIIKNLLNSFDKKDLEKIRGEIESNKDKIGFFLEIKLSALKNYSPKLYEEHVKEKMDEMKANLNNEDIEILENATLGDVKKVLKSIV